MEVKEMGYVLFNAISAGLYISNRGSLWSFLIIAVGKVGK
jgi:hypothetical protein